MHSEACLLLGNYNCVVKSRPKSTTLYRNARPAMCRDIKSDTWPVWHSSSSYPEINHTYVRKSPYYLRVSSEDVVHSSKNMLSDEMTGNANMALDICTCAFVGGFLLHCWERPTDCQGHVKAHCIPGWRYGRVSQGSLCNLDCLIRGHKALHGVPHKLSNHIFTYRPIGS